MDFSERKGEMQLRCREKRMTGGACRIQRRTKNDILGCQVGIGRTCALGLLGLWHSLEEDTIGALVAAVNEWI